MERSFSRFMIGFVGMPMVTIFFLFTFIYKTFIQNTMSPLGWILFSILLTIWCIFSMIHKWNMAYSENIDKKYGYTSIILGGIVTLFAIIPIINGTMTPSFFAYFLFVVIWLIDAYDFIIQLP